MTAVVGVLVGAAVALVLLPWAGGRRTLVGDRRGAGYGRGADGRGRRSPSSRAPRRARASSWHRSRGAGDELDPAFVLDLCAAAVRGGVAVPTALAVTGRHLGGTDGAALVQVGTALGLGATWESAWAGAPASLAVLRRVLGTGLAAGASPGTHLRAAASALRRDRRARVRVAAGALAVRLTLPLGLCFLPAFVVLGLVPVVVGLAGGLVGGAG